MPDSPLRAGIPDAPDLAVPPAESPFLERILETAKLSGADRALMREFAEKGYVVVDTAIEDFDELAARLIEDLAPRYPAGVHRRIDEAWYFSDDVRRIATCAGILELLRTLYRREPIPFQTLNFDRGTQQPAHSDTLHFHCVPRRYMCGAWVALEDIHEGSGPLVVYPGSHTLPDLDMHDLGLPSGPEHYEEYERRIGEIARVKGFEELAVTPKKGQAIIWAANLLHGGQAVRDAARTRHSQVTHYYFEGGLYYFPMSSDPYMKSLCMREVIDIRTGRFVPHRYRGEVVDLDDYFMAWRYPRPLPGWVEEPPRGAANGSSESPERLADRVRTLQETVNGQRALLEERGRELAEVRALLHELWASKPFKLVHGAAKTWKRLFPGRSR